MSGAKFLLGDYDQQRDKFVVTAGGDFNFGAWDPAGVHAPSAYPDGKDGVIAIFNMNPGKPTSGWDQIMTLPRRLRLSGKDELSIEPAGDIESLRGDHRRVEAMKLPANQEMVLENIRGNAVEIVAEIDTGDAPMLEMDVLRSPDGGERTRILFFRNRGYRDRSRERGSPPSSLITIDSSYSSSLPDVLSRPPETAPVFMGQEEMLKLRAPRVRRRP